MPFADDLLGGKGPAGDGKPAVLRGSHPKVPELKPKVAPTPPVPVRPLFTKGLKPQEENLLKMLEARLGVRLPDQEGTPLPPLNTAAIAEKTEHYDCFHPHTLGCWRLLKRSLDNSAQAMTGTTPERVEQGLAQLESLRGAVASPLGLAIRKDFDDELSKWLTDHPQHSPKQQEGDPDVPLDPALDKVLGQEYPSDFARFQSLLYVIGQQVAAQAEMLGGGGDPLKSFVGGLLDRTEAGLHKHQVKNGFGQDAGVHDLFPFHSATPQEAPLQRQKAATSELLTLVDMALGAGDVKLFREAMAVLKEVNPSAYQAIVCLKGTSAALLEMETLNPELNRPAAKDLLRPSVAQLMQGADPREDVKGGLTGTTYFKKKLPGEVANPVLAGFVEAGIEAGKIAMGWVGGKLLDMAAQKAAEPTRGPGNVAAEKADSQTKGLVTQKQHEELKARNDLQDAKDSGQPSEVIKEKESVVGKRHDELERAELIEKIWKGGGAMPFDALAMVEKERRRDAKEKQPAAGEPGDGQPAAGKSGDGQPAAGKSGDGQPAAGQSGGDQQGKGGEGKQGNAGDFDAGKVEPGDLFKELPAGSGGKAGELVDPFAAVPPMSTSDFAYMVMSAPEILTIFDHPAFADYVNSLVAGAVERLVLDKQRKLLEVEYTEEQWLALMADETRVIDPNDPRVSEIPGDTPADCFTADPVPGAIEPGVI